jgi:hypothetical protein
MPIPSAAVTASTLEHRYGVPVLVCAADGPALRDDADLLDVIGEASAHQAELVLLPVERLPAEFFPLRSGVAGSLVQKFVNYRLRLAILGDVSVHVAGNDAVRDFVHEANRGRQLWFVATEDELNQRLAATASAG